MRGTIWREGDLGVNFRYRDSPEKSRSDKSRQKKKRNGNDVLKETQYFFIFLRRFLSRCSIQMGADIGDRTFNSIRSFIIK